MVPCWLYYRKHRPYPERNYTRALGDLEFGILPTIVEVKGVYQVVTACTRNRFVVVIRKVYLAMVLTFVGFVVSGPLYQSFLLTHG